MKLSVIIVNFNTGALTKACVESVLKQELVGGLEIIVVDNNSSDESVNWLRSDFPEIKVIANDDNNGLSAGVNIGLAAAKGDYVLLLNPDIIVLDKALSKMIDYMRRQPEVGMLGGQLLSANGDLQYSCFRFYSPLTILFRRTKLGRMKRGQREIDRFLMKDYDHARPRDVDWMMAACMMLRREAVKKIGGMDERFFLYFEDVDWCRRMWEGGWRVTYLPAAKFSHYHQQESQSKGVLSMMINRVAWEHVKSAVKYFWKHRGKAIVYH